jgi:spindle assembly abnormal protein 6
VQITNELDPFFFYSLEVNEDDFQSLKVEQCILVDFATFPYKFIELLEQCIVSSCTDNPRFVPHSPLTSPNIPACTCL